MVTIGTHTISKPWLIFIGVVTVIAIAGGPLRPVGIAFLIGGVVFQLIKLTEGK